MLAFGAATQLLVGLAGLGGLAVKDTGTVVLFHHVGTVGTVCHSSWQHPAKKEELVVLPPPPPLGPLSIVVNSNCVNVLCGHKLPISGPMNTQLPGVGDQLSLPSGKTGALPKGMLIPVWVLIPLPGVFSSCAQYRFRSLDCAQLSPRGISDSWFVQVIVIWAHNGLPLASVPSPIAVKQSVMASDVPATIEAYAAWLMPWLATVGTVSATTMRSPFVLKALV